MACSPAVFVRAESGSGAPDEGAIARVRDGGLRSRQATQARLQSLAGSPPHPSLPHLARQRGLAYDGRRPRREEVEMESRGTSRRSARAMATAQPAHGPRAPLERSLERPRLWWRRLPPSRRDALALVALSLLA